jgi:hypothetical protein
VLDLSAYINGVVLAEDGSAEDGSPRHTFFIVSPADGFAICQILLEDG